MEQGNITDALLMKYLLGEVTDAERGQVQHWLTESDNKKHYYELKLVWDQSQNALLKSTINTEEAWGRLKARLAKTQSGRTIPMPSSNYKWLRVAAVLLLLAGGGLLAWYLAPQKELAEAVLASVNIDTPNIQNNKQIENIPEQNNEVNEAPVNDKPTVVKVKKGYSPTRVATAINVAPPTLNSVAPHKYICNGTACPLEVCITQSLTCGNRKPVSYSTCNTLEPDEAGQLSLKIGGVPTQNCRQTIQEIRITRMTTGESIVLNAESSPSTAQELYNYITGQKKGDILAGVFHTDCENEESEHTLRFDNNNYGHLILQ
ncbi:MAG: hypothetical protein JWQ38_3789 [Flavipsychrobacter sp.]|nr:hypothetical protein [Flavipsychrobacter sp.]